jgi:hypothetical protein
MGIIYFVYILATLFLWANVEYTHMSYLFSSTNDNTCFIVITFLVFSFTAIIRAWTAFILNSLWIFLAAAENILAASLCLACDIEDISEKSCHNYACQFAAGSTSFYFSIALWTVLRSQPWDVYPVTCYAILFICTILYVGFEIGGGAAYSLPLLQLIIAIFVFLLDYYISFTMTLQTLRAGGDVIPYVQIAE